MRHFLVTVFLLPVLLVGLPLAGLSFKGEDISPYLEFPPLTRFVRHAPFSWTVFILLALLVIITATPLIRRIIQGYGAAAGGSRRKFPFPWWGSAGLMLTAVSWWLAWTRFQWFGALQAYTFFPLWLGYIIFLNGLTFARTGHCLLIDRSRFFLALFPVSSLFWWFFEYLNRFVQNWHYLGVENFSSGEYILHASLCFSTVLPAVQSTEVYLGSFPSLALPLKHWRPFHLQRAKTWGWLLIFLAAPALAGISVYPDYLFPMLWLAPLLIITAVQAISGEPTVFRGLAQGDWRGIWIPALAALLCGFFWEMWNYKSQAHWEYSVPFVQRFHIFAMPLLGYAGYLPFGLECMALSRMLDRVLESEVYD